MASARSVPRASSIPGTRSPCRRRPALSTTASGREGCRPLPARRLPSIRERPVEACRGSLCRALDLTPGELLRPRLRGCASTDGRAGWPVLLDRQPVVSRFALNHRLYCSSSLRSDGRLSFCSELRGASLGPTTRDDHCGRPRTPDGSPRGSCPPPGSGTTGIPNYRRLHMHQCRTDRPIPPTRRRRAETSAMTPVEVYGTVRARSASGCPVPQTALV